MSSETKIEIIKLKKTSKGVMLRLTREKCNEYHTLYMLNKNLVSSQEKVIQNQQEEIAHLYKIIELLKLDPFDNRPLQLKSTKALEIKKPR